MVENSLDPGKLEKVPLAQHAKTAALRGFAPPVAPRDKLNHFRVTRTFNFLVHRNSISHFRRRQLLEMAGNPNLEIPRRAAPADRTAPQWSAPLEAPSHRHLPPCHHRDYCHDIDTTVNIPARFLCALTSSTRSYRYFCAPDKTIHFLCE